MQDAGLGHAEAVLAVSVQRRGVCSAGSSRLTGVRASVADVQPRKGCLSARGSKGFVPVHVCESSLAAISASTRRVLCSLAHLVAMAPKFSDKRRAELQASSPKTPSPRLARVGKAELTAELWLVAYSQNSPQVISPRLRARR